MNYRPSLTVTEEIKKWEDILKGSKKIRGMAYYIPNHVQYKAHRSKAKVIAVVKGNRLGGSTWGAEEIALHITKDYPKWYPEERKFDRPIKIRIGTDKFFKIDSVIEPKLRSLMPEDEFVKIRRSPQGYITKMFTKDGSMIEFLTSEQDQMAWEGQDLDFFWGDEPCKRSHYIATQRGLLDRSGQTILSFTPLIEPWMKEDIVDKADGKNIEIFYGTTRDNMFDIEGNPILREEDIARFEATLTEDEVETRIKGRFFHLRGMVYKEFCDEHLLNDFSYSQEFAGFPVVGILDPHDRQPHHVIWAMIDRTGDIIVMYEQVKEGTLKELAALILATENYFHWNVLKRFIDPNFGRKRLIGVGKTVIQELLAYKVAFTEADDNKEAGRLKVKGYLHYDVKKEIDINNRPKLYFVRESCPKTIHSMRNYQYDEWQMGDDREPKEKEKQKDTHGADCVRYLCKSTPSFYKPAIYQPNIEGAYY